MKKAIIVATVLLLATCGTYQDAVSSLGSPTPVIDYNAPHRRLDKVKGVPASQRTNSGDWELGIWNTGDWGNSGCTCAGTHCQIGDYLTWWYNIEPSNPEGTDKGTDMGTKTILGWDSATHDYIWGYKE